MELEVKKKNNVVAYEDLQQGDVFTWGECVDYAMSSEYFLRVQEELLSHPLRLQKIDSRLQKIDLRLQRLKKRSISSSCDIYLVKDVKLVVGGGE